MSWQEDRPESERPADDAPREVWWVQGGVPIARQRLIYQRDDPDDPGNWSLAELEPAFFAGLGAELCYWYWAQDHELASEVYQRRAVELAEELEGLAARARRAATQRGQQPRKPFSQRLTELAETYAQRDPGRLERKWTPLLDKHRITGYDSRVKAACALEDMADLLKGATQGWTNEE